MARTEPKKMKLLKKSQWPTLGVIWGELNEKKYARPQKHHLEVEIFTFQNTHFFNFYCVCTPKTGHFWEKNWKIRCFENWIIRPPSDVLWVWHAFFRFFRPKLPLGWVFGRFWENSFFWVLGSGFWTSVTMVSTFPKSEKWRFWEGLSSAYTH